MYAVIESGGKQYRVSPGQRPELDLLPGKEGEEIELDRVLFISNGNRVLTGQPFIEGAKVRATVLEHGRSKKILVFKYKPKVRYRRKKGHRPFYTRVLIEEIVLPKVAWRTKRQAEAQGSGEIA